MKKTVAMLLALIFIIALPACSAKTYFGFSKQKFTVVEEQDTHGGFHGDGSYYLVLDCSNHAEAALNIVERWNKLPLSENLDMFIYGEEVAQLPRIENGYYCFQDRHPEAINPSDDSELFSRWSFNFSLAVYDSDTNMFYYFEFDT